MRSMMKGNLPFILGRIQDKVCLEYRREFYEICGIIMYKFLRMTGIGAKYASKNKKKILGFIP